MLSNLPRDMADEILRKLPVTSSVRDKHLAVLFQKLGRRTMNIWISNKIEPNAVSWNKLFLTGDWFDMKPITRRQIFHRGGSFFVDEKKRVAVVLDNYIEKGIPTRDIAYIIGKKGYFKQVDLGETTDPKCWPLVCSFAPSSVQIN